MGNNRGFEITRKTTGDREEDGEREKERKKDGDFEGENSVRKEMPEGQRKSPL